MGQTMPISEERKALEQYLPQSLSELAPTEDVLFDLAFPFEMTRDRHGQETVPPVRVPSGMREVVRKLIGTRRIPLKDESSFVRAALGHYIKHVLERLDDTMLEATWLPIEQAAQAARYIKSAAEVSEMIADVEQGLAVILDGGDEGELQEALERFFSPIVRLSDERRRKRMILAAFENSVIKRGMQVVVSKSDIVRRVRELWMKYQKVQL